MSGKAWEEGKLYRSGFRVRYTRIKNLLQGMDGLKRQMRLDASIETDDTEVLKNLQMMDAYAAAIREELKPLIFQLQYQIAHPRPPEEETSQ